MLFGDDFPFAVINDDDDFRFVFVFLVESCDVHDSVQWDRDFSFLGVEEAAKLRFLGLRFEGYFVSID